MFTDCQTEGCDFDYFRSEIPFVDYVRDREEASLHILITSASTGGGGTASPSNFIDRGELAGATDTLRYVSGPTARPTKNLFKGCSLNLYAGVFAVRDQLYLAKGKLTDEEILVRRRKLASRYSYFTGFAIRYSFGSIFNNIVNPRFAGIGGSTAFF